ncbi:hypothetical protein D3C72_1034530 [compost metagenome]
MRTLSLISPIKLFTGAPSSKLSISSCNGVSAVSQSITTAGLYLTSCLAISLPIDPAAPVTRTFFPLISLTTLSLRIEMTSRSSSCSILIFFNCVSSNWLLVHFSLGGTCCILMFSSRQASTRKFSFSLLINGSARINSSVPSFFNFCRF